MIQNYEEFIQIREKSRTPKKKEKIKKQEYEDNVSIIYSQK
jgi:hypothetical protein